MYPFRSSLEAHERPCSTQHVQKQKCIICGKTQHDWIREKFWICEAPCANKFLQTAIYLQDEVFTKIADLEKESSVFGADVTTIKLALKVPQVILLFLWYNPYKIARI